MAVSIAYRAIAPPTADTLAMRLKRTGASLRLTVIKVVIIIIIRFPTINSRIDRLKADVVELI